MSDCRDPRLHDLLGAYALGACPPAEREAVRAHLDVCPACASDLAELTGVREALLAAVPAETAPPELKSRVMRQVHAEAELFRAARPAPSRDDVAGRRRSRLARRVPLGAAAALAAALALAGGVTGALIAGDDGGAPSSRTVAAQVDQRVAPGAHAALVASGDQARLIVDGLPSPGPSRVYQVWLQSGDDPPRPAGALFGVSRDGRGATVLPDGLRGVDQVLVSSEPVGGSLQPTRAPVLSARV